MCIFLYPIPKLVTGPLPKWSGPYQGFTGIGFCSASFLILLKLVEIGQKNVHPQNLGSKLVMLFVMLVGGPCHVFPWVVWSLLSVLGTQFCHVSIFWSNENPNKKKYKQAVGFLDNFICCFPSNLNF